MNNKVKNLKLYNYKASLKNGRIIKGKIVSYSEQEAKQELKSRDVYVLKIVDRTPFLAQFYKPSELEKGMLFDKISSQLKAGSDFQRILSNLKRENFSFQTIKLIESLLLEIKQGKSFSDSIRSLNVFEKDTIEILYAGEESGKLVDVLKDLSELFIERAAIYKTLRKATYKPLGLIIFSFLIIIFIIPRLIEPIKSVYKSFSKGKGAEHKIPALTEFIVDAVNFISGIGGALTFVILFGFFLLLKRIYYSNDKFKTNIDFFIINFPVIGLFYQKLFSYVIFLSLDILYRAGVPIAVSFFMISKSQKNNILRDDLLSVSQELKEGKSLYKAINQSMYIKPLLKDFIIQGDLNGTLEEELRKGKKVAKEDFDEYSGILVKSLVSFISILISLIIGIIIISVYLPIFSMVSNIMSNM